MAVVIRAVPLVGLRLIRRPVVLCDGLEPSSVLIVDEISLYELPVLPGGFFFTLCVRIEDGCISDMEVFNLPRCQ